MSSAASETPSSSPARTPSTGSGSVSFAAEPQPASSESARTADMMDKRRFFMAHSKSQRHITAHWLPRTPPRV